MDVSRKRAKACPDDGIADGGAKSPTAAQQIAELQAELERCKTEHDQMVSDLKGSYSGALEWAYSVETIPRDYWLEKGHTEDYVGAMDFFLEQFKHTIKKLRTGDEVCGRIGINIAFRLQDEEGCRVNGNHDDALMPYWSELANAIIHWSEYHANRETPGLLFYCIELPDAVLDVLRPAIKQSKVSHVGFIDDGSSRTWKLAKIMEDIIQTNLTVTRVGFTSVMFSNEEWKTMCNAIRIRNAGQASNMQLFQLSDCFDDGMNTEVLKEILTSTTASGDKEVVVRLDGNRMSSQEAPIIAEFLASNPSIAELGLASNRFDDADAAMLANSLSSNTNLRSLVAGGNDAIKLNGRLAFLRALFDVTSLVSCAASNHTCQVQGLEQDISALNEYDDFSINKWEKVFTMLALSSEDSFINTALLKDVPVSLMPVLLDQADAQIEEGNSRVTDLYLELTGTKRNQRHDDWDNSEQTRKISCVFELVRSWVVPSLYV